LLFLNNFYDQINPTLRELTETYIYVLLRVASETQVWRFWHWMLL